MCIKEQNPAYDLLLYVLSNQSIDIFDDLI